MSATVCLLANTLYYPQGGGHMWPYLNWALGLKALGFEVVWLETIGDRAADVTAEHVQQFVGALKERLDRYGLGHSIALCSWTGDTLPAAMLGDYKDLDAATASDLLLSLAYNAITPEVLKRFRRTALIDIDPGLTQIWMAEGQMVVGRYDTYFTIGEWATHTATDVPRCGLEWHYTPPPVYLPSWPATAAPASGTTFTSVTHWGGEGVEFHGLAICNGKRDGFLPFLDLPRRSPHALELAIHLKGYGEDERALWRNSGWSIRNAHDVACTPWDYQAYVQGSRGEFSCAKPAYVQLQSGWVSDRTICYLASGRPAIVQHTGASAFLPDAGGLFRFRTPDEAVRCLDQVVNDYPRQCALSRQLAEEAFSATHVVERVLERAL